MTKQQKEKKIYAFQEKLPFGQISEASEFYLVEQGKEADTLKTLMR